MKKMIITFMTAVILVLSMSISVFAWFSNTGQNASLGDFEMGYDVNIYFDFDTNYDMILDAARFEDLTYLTDNDIYKGTITDFGGLSTNISVTIKNEKKDKFKIYAGVGVEASLQSGPYSGVSNAFLYLVYSEDDVIKAASVSKDPVQYIMETQIYNFDSTGMTQKEYVNKVLNNLKQRNGINILGNKTQETMFIATWGYYDGLKGQTYNSIDMQEVYYSLVYSVTFQLRGALM